MERKSNYLIQAQQAKQTFLGYDQEKLIAKLKLRCDEAYLYTALLSQPYRIHRRTADISRLKDGQWVDGNSHAEVMTLLDLICDSRETRYLACKWKNMSDFGQMFHRDLLDGHRNAYAVCFDADPESFRRACAALGGTPLPIGDVAYAIDFFDGLPIAVQLWFGDEEFPPALRYLWDANADMYLKYETMYFALDILLAFLSEHMPAPPPAPLW